MDIIRTIDIYDVNTQEEVTDRNTDLIDELLEMSNLKNYDYVVGVDGILGDCTEWSKKYPDFIIVIGGEDLEGSEYREYFFNGKSKTVVPEIIYPLTKTIYDQYLSG